MWNDNVVLHIGQTSGSDFFSFSFDLCDSPRIFAVTRLYKLITSVSCNTHIHAVRTVNENFYGCIIQPVI